MYALIAEIAEIGLLAPPFDLSPVIEAHDRVWLDRGTYIDRCPGLNRYTGEVVYLTQPVGFGEGAFGTAIFGWS
jgi:hypothetical protein